MESGSDGHASVRNRILAELHRTLRSLSDEHRALGEGWALRTRSLPFVWSLNELRITGPATVDRVIDLAEEHQADLDYRHVVVEDNTIGQLLQEALGTAGWTVDTEVLMALDRSSDRNVDTSAVVELSETQMLSLMRRWDTEEHPGISDQALDQLQAYTLREGRLWNERCFGVLDRRSDPIALTKLRSHESTGWVEDVYTVPEARGQGYARVLVSHATELARSAKHNLTFMMADDNDWPKHLYAAIGFRPVGTIHTFHRDRQSHAESPDQV